ncbi:hypothetical protein B4923_02680 [Brenneria roseae subsp. americana]|uniref:Uncharacterized protein n=1 Tax=Brenneria roseae subsp. americana TaxID=1508507 RepID=A0A2U1TZZ0_9GAMM|nr:hypothetical protein [Brenneria roseae]PWC14963.1 hypothetical protein B4923_02680 [Brenneria roseae subsp. americana]
MNMTLNQSIIINKLSVDVKPAFDPEGRIIDVPNPERKPYLITDNHRDSPVGFGAKISTTKKNRYHPATGRARATDGNRDKAPQDVIRATIGNVSDFVNIDQTRETARNFAQTMEQTKRSPNAIRKEINVAELTISF